eukprot:g5249.t1
MLHYEASKKLQQLEAVAATNADALNMRVRDNDELGVEHKRKLLEAEIEAQFPKALRPPYDPTVAEIVSYGRMTILNIGTGVDNRMTSRACRLVGEEVFEVAGASTNDGLRPSTAQTSVMDAQLPTPVSLRPQDLQSQRPAASTKADENGGIEGVVGGKDGTVGEGAGSGNDAEARDAEADTYALNDDEGDGDNIDDVKRLLAARLCRTEPRGGGDDLVLMQAWQAQAAIAATADIERFWCAATNICIVVLGLLTTLFAVVAMQDLMLSDAEERRSDDIRSGGNGGEFGTGGAARVIGNTAWLRNPHARRMLLKLEKQSNDTALTPLGPDLYAKHRLNPSQRAFQNKAQELQRKLLITSYVSFALGGASTLLVMRGVPLWTAFTVALQNALSALIAAEGYEAAAARANDSAVRLQAVKDWWDALTEPQRMSTVNRERLVNDSEATIGGHLDGWLAAMQTSSEDKDDEFKNSEEERRNRIKQETVPPASDDSDITSDDDSSSTTLGSGVSFARRGLRRFAMMLHPYRQQHFEEELSFSTFTSDVSGGNCELELIFDSPATDARGTGDAGDWRTARALVLPNVLDMRKVPLFTIRRFVLQQLFATLLRRAVGKRRATLALSMGTDALDEVAEVEDVEQQRQANDDITAVSWDEAKETADESKTQVGHVKDTPSSGFRSPPNSRMHRRQAQQRLQLKRQRERERERQRQRRLARQQERGSARTKIDLRSLPTISLGVIIVAGDGELDLPQQHGEGGAAIGGEAADAAGSDAGAASQVEQKSNKQMQNPRRG